MFSTIGFLAVASFSWLFWLFTLNSCLNPFIYMAFNRELVHTLVAGVSSCCCPSCNAPTRTARRPPAPSSGGRTREATDSLLLLIQCDMIKFVNFLVFFSDDFQSSLANESAVQKPKHCLTWEISLPQLIAHDKNCKRNGAGSRTTRKISC